jgi:hypothetical protein
MDIPRDVDAPVFERRVFHVFFSPVAIDTTRRLCRR